MTTWQANYAYHVGDILIDPQGNTQQCTSAGTSGAALPPFSAVVGNSIVDNTVVWQCVGVVMTPFTLADVTSHDWSLALDESVNSSAPGSGLGQVVQSLDDITQCLRIIVTTPKGTDPLRPDFAVDIFDYIDRPINQFLPRFVRTVTDAIAKYEPRVVLLNVTVQPTQDQTFGRLNGVLTWRPKVNVTPSSAITTFITLPRLN